MKLARGTCPGGRCLRFVFRRSWTRDSGAPARRFRSFPPARLPLPPPPWPTKARLHALTSKLLSTPAGARCPQQCNRRPDATTCLPGPASAPGCTPVQLPGLHTPAPAAAAAPAGARGGAAAMLHAAQQTGRPQGRPSAAAGRPEVAAGSRGRARVRAASLYKPQHQQQQEAARAGGAAFAALSASMERSAAAGGAAAALGSSRHAAPPRLRVAVDVDEGAAAGEGRAPPDRSRARASRQDAATGGCPGLLASDTRPGPCAHAQTLPAPAAVCRTTPGAPARRPAARRPQPPTA